MAGLVNAIRSFRSGGLSHNEFLAQVDRIVATDQADSTRLLQILNEEHTNFPLPDDVYAEVQQRIEHPPEATGNSISDDTRLQTTPAQRSSASMPPTGGNVSSAEPEQMKGVGDTLNGRFVLEECLGIGGMGMVYKALDLRKLEASDRNPYIAIKVLNVQFRGHPKSLIALQREAKKAQRLAHPNIVTVYDFDRDGAVVYLTMEFLSGRPLSYMLRAPDFKGLTYARAMPIVSGIAKALSYAHERGFVHCDLKPANVFLTDGGEVKVIDFGIARVIPKPEHDVEATIFDPGSLGGVTPAYASLEMLEHREPDPRDDIFALACITYELLTGHHPFDRVPALQARSAGMKPPRPKGLGRRQWRALKAGLAFDRQARTPTAEQFFDEMSGNGRKSVYIAMMAASLVVAGLFGAAFLYLWEFQSGRESEREAPEAPAEAAPPAAPPAASAPAPAPTLATIAPILARVPCSALLPVLRGDTLQIQGYLSRSYGDARVKEALAAVPGLRSVQVDTQPVNEEQCGVIDTFAPYWRGNRQAGGATAIQTKAPKGTLTEGDPLVVNITTPGYDTYVHIDYYVLDGSVVHMVPSRRAKDNQAPPNYAATIGGLGNWVISKPFGSELIVLLVTPSPLFDSLRPESEPRTNYLQAVQERLKQIGDKYGRERIAADFVQINTKAKKP
jgi:hypothetical protein